MALSELLNTNLNSKSWSDLYFDSLTTNGIKLLADPSGGYIIKSDSVGNMSWKPASGGTGTVLRIDGSQNTVNVSGVSVILNENSLSQLTLISLANGVDGQTIQIIADSSAVVVIKNNTSVGVDQVIQNNTNADITIPSGGHTFGMALATYSSTLSKWLCVAIS